MRFGNPFLHELFMLNLPMHASLLNLDPSCFLLCSAVVSLLLLCSCLHHQLAKKKLRSAVWERFSEDVLVDAMSPRHVELCESDNFGTSLRNLMLSRADHRADRFLYTYLKVLEINLPNWGYIAGDKSYISWFLTHYTRKHVYQRTNCHWNALIFFHHIKVSITVFSDPGGPIILQSLSRRKCLTHQAVKSQLPVHNRTVYKNDIGMDWPT